MTWEIFVELIPVFALALSIASYIIGLINSQQIHDIRIDVPGDVHFTVLKKFKVDFAENDKSGE